MSYFNIWLNIQQRQFIWLKNRLKLLSFIREIRADHKTLAVKPNPTYQQDIRDRDLAFTQENTHYKAKKNSFILIKILSRSAIVNKDLTYRSETDSNVDNIQII